jgi:hypothetical protein
MCVDHSKACSCGKRGAGFNLRDEVLPFEVVTELYCPACSRDVAFDPASMLSDNGWIIRYDMDVVRFAMQRMYPASDVTPEFIFDEGYCTWRAVTPTDHVDSVKERQELAKLAKTDPKKYFEEMRSWANTRMERLARAGWRKAQEKETLNT